MSNLGIGVMIGILGGNENTVNAVKRSLGKKIESIVIAGDEKLTVSFADGKLEPWDGGQSCCERRYMDCADNLSEYKGSTLVDVELVDATQGNESKYDSEHEIQFLNLKTDRGVIQVANHNEHNGYYGGFHIVAQWTA